MDAHTMPTHVRCACIYSFRHMHVHTHAPTQIHLNPGVVKMNIDTDTQWSYWDGLRAYEAKYVCVRVCVCMGG